MPDYSTMKLGKLAARPDLRRMARAQLALARLPSPPDTVDWSNGHADWGGMLNDQIGDCTIAAIAHAIQVATLQTDGMVTPPDSAVLSAYERWTGYNPADPSTDRGAYEDDVLRRWQQEGFAGFKLLDYVEPNPHVVVQVKQSVAHFGLSYVGATLPMSARRQKVWDVVPGDDGGIWGGHALVIAGYSPDGVTFITWGKLQRATWAWVDRYMDECHCLLIEPWLKRYPAATSAEVLGMLQDVQA